MSSTVVVECFVFMSTSCLLLRRSTEIKTLSLSLSLSLPSFLPLSLHLPTTFGVDVGALSQHILLQIKVTE